MRIIGIIIAILCFMILIIGHEFGHFSVAKLLGMRVNEFSLGMGPLLFQKEKGETKYSVRAIPIGGFCALEGEDGDSEDPRAFSKQPAWAKILVLVAGAFMNVVLGIIVFTMVFTNTGVTVPKLSQVMEGKPAAEAGLLAGDTIVGVNGEYYGDFQSVASAITASKGDTVSITVKRDGQNKTFECKTYVNEYGNRAIGIMASVSHSFGDCLKAGIRETGVVALSIRDFFTGLFKGNASVNDVSGIVGVVSIAGEAAEYGIINVIYLMAMISANLGYMNLLPIPALDGGRILMTIIRAIFKDKISDEAEGMIHAAGMILLLILMVLIMFKDTISLFK
ncbi:MAG: RIP metalloprotease RseP [Clostridia bacterium]|nr:RIP metalloprotease RseP [Clostridia bacterium]